MIVGLADEVFDERPYKTEHFDEIITGYREAFFEHFGEQEITNIVGRMRRFALDGINGEVVDGPDNATDEARLNVQDIADTATSSDSYFGTVRPEANLKPGETPINPGSRRPIKLHPHTQLIDMKSEGRITPHKDSTLLYGDFTCGLNLSSHAVMRFERVHKDARSEQEERIEDYYAGLVCLWGPPQSRPDWERKPILDQQQRELDDELSKEGAGPRVVYVVLPPRSLYLMTGASRSEWTHVILSRKETEELVNKAGSLSGLTEDQLSQLKQGRDRRLSFIVRDLGELDFRQPWWKQLLRAYEPDSVKIFRRSVKNLSSPLFYKSWVSTLGDWAGSGVRATNFKGETKS